MPADGFRWVLVLVFARIDAGDGECDWRKGYAIELWGRKDVEKQAMGEM